MCAAELAERKRRATKGVLELIHAVDSVQVAGMCVDEESSDQ